MTEWEVIRARLTAQRVRCPIETCGAPRGEDCTGLFGRPRELPHEPRLVLARQVIEAERDAMAEMEARFPTVSREHRQTLAEDHGSKPPTP